MLLLSRLRTMGTERGMAGNRRLFVDQDWALILMSLISPAIESLRDLQRACALDKVRKRLGVSRASLDSLSESVAIFDPTPQASGSRRWKSRWSRLTTVT